jgi:hypothetical protein
MTTTSATEFPIPIWQQVMERPSIRVNDNFLEENDRIVRLRWHW